MSRVAVLDHNQSETDQARCFVNRSVGKLLVRRAFAYWVIKNSVLRKLPPHEVQPLRAVDVESGTTPLYVLYQADSRCKSPRSGTLRWEPPKHKRDLKPHPWRDMIVSNG